MKATPLTTTLITALSLSSFAGSYTVKAGDTVSSISREHKISISNIIKLNKISDPTKLRIGQSLNIPTSSTSSASKPSQSSAPKTGTYKVAKGDTFYSIARRHRLSVTQLSALNPSVNSQLITPGQSLAVTGKPIVAVKKVEKKPVTTAKVIKKAPTPKKIEKAAPKMISTAITLAQVTTDPTPKQETIAILQKKGNTPISTPPAPPMIENPAPAAAPSSVTSVILTDQITFDAFASKHGTNTTQLNALNGWNLPKATVLARGSEIYVPQ